MKIVSWNVRGLAGREKRRSIKEMVTREKPDIIILQETKRAEISWREVGAVWGVRFKEWDFIPMEGRSGGGVNSVGCESSIM